MRCGVVNWRGIIVIEDQESVSAWADQTFGLAATRALDYFGKLIIEHPFLHAESRTSSEASCRCRKTHCGPNF
jgi:hypothetical protein